MPLISKTIKIPNNYDISKRLLIIDNNPTFIDYTENLLLCPSYNYMKFYDLRETLPNYNKCEELKSYISRLTKEQRIGKISKKKPENLEKTYKWLYKKCKKINKYNSDRFFLLQKKIDSQSIRSAKLQKHSVAIF